MSKIVTKRDIRIFVSGAYTGDVNHNIKKATFYAVTLWDWGYTPFVPHLNSAYFESLCSNTKYDDFLNGYLGLIYLFHGMLMVPGWKTSNGSTKERERAKIERVPVFYGLLELNKYFEKEMGFIG